jgi:hypothetical protein
MGRRVDVEAASAEDVCLEGIGPLITCEGKGVEDERSNQNGRDPSGAYQERYDEPILLSGNARGNAAPPEAHYAEPVFSPGHDSPVSSDGSPEDHDKSP